MPGAARSDHPSVPVVTAVFRLVGWLWVLGGLAALFLAADDFTWTSALVFLAAWTAAVALLFGLGEIVQQLSRMAE